MNVLEWRNLTDLAENSLLTDSERATINRILTLRKFGPLSNADIAEVSWVRACAARPGLRGTRAEDIMANAYRVLGRKPPDDPT